MDDDPLFCENCEASMTDVDVEVVEPVPRLDPDPYMMQDETAEVDKCGDCGFVIGFDRHAPDAA